MVAWVPDMFCNFYFVKSYKIDNKLTNTATREKLNTDLESLEFLKHFDACLTKLENHHILLNKISQRFIETNKTERASLHSFTLFTPLHSLQGPML